MEITRRESLGLGASLIATPAFSARTSHVSPSLKSIAAQSGRQFGSAVAWGPRGADRGSFANPAYSGILQRECNLLVPENELKWQWSRPSANSFNFTAFDEIAAYARRYQFALRGHTLFWTPEKWYPNWLAAHD